MKKSIVCIITLLLVTGCGGKANYESIMEEYAKDYYETYMRAVQGQDKNEVSIHSLKNVNDKVGKKYDLSKLKKCKNTSYVTIIVDRKTRDIQKYEFHLQCK